MLASLVLGLAAVTMQQDFTWQGDLRPGQELQVSNLVGDIRVERAAGRRAEVRAVKHAGRRGSPEDVEVRAEESGSGVRVCVRYHGDRADRGWRCGDGTRGSNRNAPNDTRVEFIVRLPEGVHLEAATVAGDVDARGLTAEARVTTVSGRVVVNGFAGDRLEARSVSGDLELHDIRGRQVQGETVSGDVTYDGTLQRDGDYGFKTLSGRVTVTLPAGAGADLRASTFSGRIRFPEAALSDVSIRRNNRATARLGGGGPTLWVESFSGDVEVRAGR